MILETQRLYLRELNPADYSDICEILKDKEVMYAYEHAFSDIEVQHWLNKQYNNYKTYGFGLWAVILKESNQLIGQTGLTMQDYHNQSVVEIGYLFKKKYWHNGYAAEAAIACKLYAFEQLKETVVYSIIRENNIASQNVAKRNGMKKIDEFIKHYYEMDMLHFVFCIENKRMDY